MRAERNVGLAGEHAPEQGSAVKLGGSADRGGADLDLANALAGQSPDRTAEYHAANSGPGDSAHAHRAGLPGRIEDEAFPALIAMLADVVVNGVHLAVERRVAPGRIHPAAKADYGHSLPKVDHVLLISVDGMHQVDLSLWIKNHPNGALAELA
jgi:hypothetical protein